MRKNSQVAKDWRREQAQKRQEEHDKLSFAEKFAKLEERRDAGYNVDREWDKLRLMKEKHDFENHGKKKRKQQSIYDDQVSEENVVENNT